MKTKKINLYTIDELSGQAQEIARKNYTNNNEYFYLESHLSNLFKERLEDLGLSLTRDEGYRLFYDLSYSQGSGLMVETALEDKKGNIFTIIHSGRYYHERSTIITGTNKKGLDLSDKELEDFEEKIYIPLCVYLKERGYEFIEYEDSMENFKEICEANNYYFTINGILEN